MKSAVILPRRAMAIFSILLWLASLASGAAQQPYGAIVKAIEVQYAGPASVSRERIMANMRTTVGQPYSQQAIEEDIRNLYSAGDITNVRIFAEPAQGGVKVVVVVQTRPVVKEVRFEGLEKLKPRSLTKQITTEAGKSLNEEVLEQDRQKIVEYYQGKGYSDIDVQYKVIPDERLGKATVVFAVNEGTPRTVKSIDFTGNTAFKASRLRKVIKTKSANVLSFVTKAGQLKNEQLEQDTGALREFYQDAGYADVQIGEVKQTPDGKGKVALTFPIVEGPKYSIASVKFTGLQLANEGEMRTRIKTRDGSVYSPKALRDDLKAIQDFYGARGYVDAQIIPETSPAGTGKVALTFRVEEGVKAYVERVNIQGNTKTKDKVIRRELAVLPGDVFDTTKVDASKARLQNTGYFGKVDAFPQDTLVPGRKDLTVQVEEKRTGTLNFGAGFSSIDSLLGFVEIAQGNFDLFHPWDFTGGGQKLRLRLQYGIERQDFILAITEPWFLDYKLAVGGEVYYREANFVSDVYSQQNYGFALNARKAITPFLFGRIEYRLENVGINDVTTNQPEITSQEGNLWQSSITLGLTYDDRDSVFLTRRGRRVDFRTYGMGGPLGGDVKLYGWNLEASQYIPLAWDTILVLNAEIATVDNYSGGDEVPIFDRLYLGGANNLRGFNFRDVGPKTAEGDWIGGNSLARLTVEYTFPVIDRVRGAIFYDIGFVNSGSYSFGTGNYNSDAGVGVRLDLPIGPIRVDLGYPLKTDQFNDNGIRFQFNVGYQF